jgi:hypothetical protein
MEIAVFQPYFATVSLTERHGQLALFGPSFRQSNQVPRSVNPGYVSKSTLRQFQTVPALATAQVQDPIIRFQPGNPDQKVNFLFRIGIVFDNIPIGFEIHRVEERLPPLVGKVALEIRYRT